MTAEQKKADAIATIGNDKCWGLWPYLPIKRHNGPKMELETGLLHAQMRTAPIPVFGAFVYKLPPTRKEFMATKKHEYASIEAIAEDGWVIDD